MTQSRAPLIVAIVLLLLPVLYVGSYLALVTPGWYTSYDGVDFNPQNYRWSGANAERFFWPLEQIDRKVRPGAWNRGVVEIRLPYPLFIKKRHSGQIPLNSAFSG